MDLLTNALSFIIFLLILNVLIIVHEFGHFLIARRNGVTVKEFAVGLGPAIWKKEWKGTVWRFNILPFGGYNNLKGESEEESGIGNFTDASKKARLKILIAGSAMNILLAIIAFYIYVPFMGFKVPTYINFSPVGASIEQKADYPNPVITSITNDSKLKDKNLVLPVILKQIGDISPKDSKEAVDAIQKYSNEGRKSIPLVVESLADKKTQTVEAEFGQNGKLGVGLNDSNTYNIDYSGNILTMAFSGISHSINSILVMVQFMQQTFGYVSRTKDVAPLGVAFSGPVGVFAVVRTIITDPTKLKLTILNLIQLTGLVSLSLGVFNLLPFPGLDGGHITLLFIEKFRGRKLNPTKVGIISVIGLLLLIGLSFLITIKDVFVFLIK